MGNTKSKTFVKPEGRNILELLPDGFYKNYLATVFCSSGTGLPENSYKTSFTGTVKKGNLVGYVLLQYLFREDFASNKAIVFFEDGVVKGHSLWLNRMFADRFEYGFTSNDVSTYHYRSDIMRAVTVYETRTNSSTRVQTSTSLETQKSIKNWNNGKETKEVIPFIPFSNYETYDPADWEFLLDPSIIGKVDRDVRDPSHPNFTYRR